MLKKILSISGKSGLYRLISYGNNIIVVEGLTDKKRIPAYSNYKIISLGDIAMYTDSEEVPLGQVFKNVYDKEEGKAIDASLYKTEAQLREFFSQVLPNYDEDRVYATDIKRVISWYNILVGAGITEFVAPEKTEEEPEKTEE